MYLLGKGIQTILKASEPCSVLWVSRCPESSAPPCRAPPTADSAHVCLPSVTTYGTYLIEASKLWEKPDLPYLLSQKPNLLCSSVCLHGCTTLKPSACEVKGQHERRGLVSFSCWTVLGTEPSPLAGVLTADLSHICSAHRFTLRNHA